MNLLKNHRALAVEARCRREVPAVPPDVLTGDPARQAHVEVTAGEQGAHPGRP